MATITYGNQITFAETMKMLGQDNRVLEVVNGLAERNDMIADAPIKEATQINADEIARVITLPTATWTIIGEGWQATMGRLQNDAEGIATLNGRSQIEVRICKRHPHPDAYRSMQEAMHLEGMSQEVANTLIYGSSGGTTPKEFDGLDVRLNALDGNTWPANGVWNNGEDTGSTCSSLFLIQWSPQCSLIYPRFHTSAGLTREDKGEFLINTAADATPYTNQASTYFYITEFEWSIGLSVADNRRIKRVCNIQSAPDDAHNLDTKVLTRAINDFEGSEPIFIYGNKQIIGQLQELVNDKQNVMFNPSAPWGTPQWTFLGHPLRVMKAITNAESVIS